MRQGDLHVLIPVPFAGTFEYCWVFNSIIFGFSNTWESQGYNYTWLNITLMQGLFDNFQQEWRSNIITRQKGYVINYLK